MLWLLLLQVWASCLWLGHGEVVQSFANTCNKFFYQQMPATRGLEPQKPAWICQTYKNKSFYATLYDKKERIPVYSAYIYEYGNSTRVRPAWMVEPQLIRNNLPKNMEKDETLRNYYSVSQKEISDSQAVYQDYLNLDNLSRGHLNPAGHHNTSESRTATFTLTNIVPQNTTLNNGAWNCYEMKNVSEKSQDCRTTYAIVGAVPGKSYISQNRVNVPSHIWASACCKTKKNTMIAWGAIAENNQNNVQILSLGHLEKELAKLYKRGPVSLFHTDCPR